MLTRLKDNAKVYVYILIIILVTLRIFIWNSNFNKEFEKCENIRSCVITCRITSIPVCKNSYVSFNAKVTAGMCIPDMVHISIKNASNLNLCYGDSLKLSAQNRPADDAMNPGNFSYRHYLKSQGVCMSLSSDIMRIKSIRHGNFSKFYSVRKSLTNKLFKYMSYNEASLANALVTGSKNELTDTVKSDFKKAGVYHIVAVSGLHLNMFILFMSYLYMHIKSKMHKKQFIILAANLLCTGFVFMFTGFGISVARAAFMTIILSLSVIVYRRYSPVHALITAAVILFLYKPYTVFDISCQLSFLATLGILAGVYIVEKYKVNEWKFKALPESLILTTGAWLFTLPVTVYAFGGVSLISFISNLLILVAAPFALCFSYLFSVICLIMPDFICRAAACITVVPLRFLINCSAFFASIPGAYVSVYPRALCMISINAAVLPAIILMCKKKYRILCTAVFIGIIAADISFVIYDLPIKPCTVSFMNVGQGDCSIIRTPEGRVVMIDCGSDSEEQITDNNILPYLYRSNIPQIDIAVISHYHKDHTSGIISLIKNHKIKKLMLPHCKTADDENEIADLIMSSALEENTAVEFISKGSTVKTDKYSGLTVLNPEKNLITDANNKSLVIMFNCYNTRVLFTGDIEDNTQYNLLSEDIKADILKIPHHGGRSLMSRMFAEKCSPKYAVISCGIDNRYGHPNPDTLKAYTDSIIYRTDKNKMTEFIIDKNSIVPKPMHRQEEK